MSILAKPIGSTDPRAKHLTRKKHQGYYKSQASEHIFESPKDLRSFDYKYKGQIPGGPHHLPTRQAAHLRILGKKRHKTLADGAKLFKESHTIPAYTQILDTGNNKIVQNIVDSRIGGAYQNNSTRGHPIKSQYTASIPPQELRESVIRANKYTNLATGKFLADRATPPKGIPKNSVPSTPFEVDPSTNTMVPK